MTQIGADTHRHTHTNKCLHTHMHMFIATYIRTYITSTNTYLHMHIHTYMVYTHTYIHKQTYIRMYSTHTVPPRCNVLHATRVPYTHECTCTSMHSCVFHSQVYLRILASVALTSLLAYTRD